MCLIFSPNYFCRQCLRPYQGRRLEDWNLEGFLTHPRRKFLLLQDLRLEASQREENSSSLLKQTSLKALKLCMFILFFIFTYTFIIFWIGDKHLLEYCILIFWEIKLTKATFLVRNELIYNQYKTGCWNVFLFKTPIVFLHLFLTSWFSYNLWWNYKGKKVNPQIFTFLFLCCL